MTVCSNQQIVRAYLPRFSACPATTANDISTPKKAEGTLRPGSGRYGERVRPEWQRAEPGPGR